MTILTSTTATVEHRAPWRENDPSAPVFHLRTGSAIERSQMEADLAGPILRAGEVFGFELRSAARRGIEHLLDGDPELDRILDLFDRIGESEEAAKSITDDEKRLLDEVQSVVAQHWPEYQELEAQQTRRRELAPVVALQRFCIDITGPGITFARDRTGMVSDATIAQFDRLELRVAGNRAFSLQYAGSQAGNSPQPSTSDDGQTTSGSDDTSKAVGKSMAKSGKKTPA